MITIDFTTTTKEEIIPDYIVDRYGAERRYDQNGDLHSYNDTPSVIREHGTKFWHKHGVKHRDNGLPAIIYPWGHKEYWENGKQIK